MSDSKNKQSLKTKNKIYKEALKIIKNQGYENLNIKSLCKTCNISIGCFYHHFKSKEAILTEIYKNADLQLAKEIRKYKTESEKVFVEKLNFIIESFMLITTNLGVNLLIHFYKAQINSENSILYSEDRKLRTFLASTIKAGQANGELSCDYDCDFIVNEIQRFLRSLLYNWCIHKGSYDVLNETKLVLPLFLSNFENKPKPLSKI